MRLRTRPVRVISPASLWIFSCIAVLSAGMAHPASGQDGLVASPDRAGAVRIQVGGETLRETAAAVSDLALIEIPGSEQAIAVWQESGADGVRDYYAMRRGVRFDPPVATRYELELRYERFDPRRDGVLAPLLLASPDSEVFIAQLVAPPVDAMLTALRSAGVEILAYLPHHAYLVRGETVAREAVSELGFVRWVGPYHAAYRLEPGVYADWAARERPADASVRYRVEVYHPDRQEKLAVAEAVDALGGLVHDFVPTGILLDVSLTDAQLAAVAGLDEVLSVSAWGDPVALMDKVREIGGANYLEGVAGYTGVGVQGEIMDNGAQLDHAAYASRLIYRREQMQIETHGTATFGICFADGTGSAEARGVLPDGTGVFSSWGPPDRYTDTAALLSFPYQSVFQSNSWGNGPFSPGEYTAEASELDLIVFTYDISILQAQGNYTTRESVRQAWGKNIVSVGGIHHFDTADLTDDRWDDPPGNASIGPAVDGRIKPDLSFWYDRIHTTTINNGFTDSFGGTSAATPETAGYFGLFFEMWADGVFGNPVGQGTVFSLRPHAATAKAVMINTASQYPFTSPEDDISRVKQGWGRPDIRRAYEWRGHMDVVDETDLLKPFESRQYSRTIVVGEPFHDELRVTLAYTDVRGTTSAQAHRINDLTLKVTSPSGVVYWGNHGLKDGNWSLPGGAANTVDTVENVLLQEPEPGVWAIEVIASEINVDGHPDTPALDANYALVVAGGIECPLAQVVRDPQPVRACHGETVRFEAEAYDVTDVHWTKDGEILVGETGQQLVIEDFEPADEGVYRMVAANGCGSVRSAPATLVPIDPPVVTRQPTSPAVGRCEGSAALIVMEAASERPLSYQWFKDGVPVDGAVGASIGFDAVGPEDAGAYHCRVSDGCGSVESEPATLSVIGAPTFTRQPRSTCAGPGGTVTLRVEAESDLPLFYQWRKDGTSLPGGSDEIVISDFSAGDEGTYVALAISINPVCTTPSATALVSMTDSACPDEDIDCDGMVAGLDIARIFNSANFNRSVEAARDARADVDQSGFVDVQDLEYLVQAGCFGL